MPSLGIAGWKLVQERDLLRQRQPVEQIVDPRGHRPARILERKGRGRGGGRRLRAQPVRGRQRCPGNYRTREDK